MKQLLPSIIHNQVGYLEDRYIGEAIRTLEDIMNYTETEGISGLLMFIDFEKAFDSIECSFIGKSSRKI